MVSQLVRAVLGFEPRPVVSVLTMEPHHMALAPGFSAFCPFPDNFGCKEAGFYSWPFLVLVPLAGLRLY